MNDVEPPPCFRTDSRGEYTGRSLVDLGNAAGVRCECTAPGEPNPNALVKSEIW